MSTNGVEVGQHWQRHPSARGVRTIRVVDKLGGSQARLRNVKTRRTEWVRYSDFGTKWVRVEAKR